MEDVYTKCGNDSKNAEMAKVCANVIHFWLARYVPVRTIPIPSNPKAKTHLVSSGTKRLFDRLSWRPHFDGWSIALGNHSGTIPQFGTL